MNSNIIIETYQTGMLECNSSIVYLSDTKDAFIIDPGEDADFIIKKIKQKNLKVEALLHTHAHYDHIGASKELKELLSIPIYLHKDDDKLYENFPLQGFILNREVGEPSSVDVYFDDNFIISFKNKPEYFFKVIHTPGHSEGCSCFYTNMTGEPLLFSGDTLFYNSIGRTDLPGGNSEKIINSIVNKLMTLPPKTKVIPGHGKFTIILHEKNTNPFLVNEKDF